MSLRCENSTAVIFGDDGINFVQPLKTLETKLNSNLQNGTNRNCVLFVDGSRTIRYNGRLGCNEYIGLAEYKGRDLFNL